jgi:5-dehydro-4-deoxyglucarate dehydratase
MPPYLASGPREGYAAYVAAVAEVLPTIIYQRGSVVLEPDQAVELARLPGVAGIKDGVGDIDRMQRIVLAVREEQPDFLFFNGLPTAELTMPAYRGIGVELYSSAVFCFAPEIAVAYLKGDERLIKEFYAPLVRLRAKVPGYAVSLVKAGVRHRGLDVGGVRPPLVDPSPEHVEELVRLIKSGLTLVEG